MNLAQSRRRLRLVVLTALALLSLLLPTVAMAAPVSIPAESANLNYGCSDYHTVQRGDTLSHIAKWYGVSQQAIMQANNIHNPSRIFVGQRLCIPGSYSPPSHGGNCAAVHTVVRGNTLSGIARYYGVSMWAIMQANGLLNANHIWTGQRLCIPGGYTPPPAPQPVPPINCWDWYTVRAGDTLFRVATWYGTTAANLRAWNGLNSNMIYVGQQLKVPVPCHVPPVQPVPPVHPCPCPPAPEPPAPAQTFFGEYFNNPTLSGAPVFTNNVSQVAFNWGQGSPGNGIPNDQFSVRFTSQQQFAPGTVRFFATSDDGVRVFVNDQLVIDGWRVQAATQHVGDITIPGGWTTIRVEYFEDFGDAVLYLNWVRVP